MSTLKSILVPTDFSKYSEHALLYAASMGERFGATITLLHVVTFVGFEDEPGASDFPDMMPLLERADRAARAHLDLGVEHGGEAQPKVRHAVVHGASAQEAILGYAEKHGADMIVMARRGHGALAHVMLGSVTERVIRFASCPVLVVVRGEREFVDPDSGAVNLTKVVVADNLAEGPERALSFMVEHLRPYRPEVHLIHAVENSLPRAYAELGVTRSFALDDELRVKIIARLRARAEAVLPEGWTLVAEVREGTPRRVVTRYAQEIRADLLVLGAERRTDLGERLLGGTAGRIVRRAPCPALVL
jgi:nucleotide-binding universal stress UspA family protein